jgi:hypothetical protein
VRNRTVTGIFDRPSDAEKVKEQLLEAGVALHRIVISRLGTMDGVDPDDSVVGDVPDPERLGDEVRNGACLLAVVARSPVDRQHIAQLMRRLGARETVESRA